MTASHETPVPHSRTVLAEQDIEAAIAVLRSGQVNESEVTRQLEQTAASLLGRQHAWATAGGTTALYAALSHRFARAFLDRGVVVRRPVKQLCNRWLAPKPDSCPRAEGLFDRVVSLPLYPSLTGPEQDAVAAATRSILA